MLYSDKIEDKFSLRFIIPLIISNESTGIPNSELVGCSINNVSLSGLSLIKSGYLLIF